MVHFEAVQRKREREYKARAWLAWHTAALHVKAQNGKMPSLDTLVGNKPKVEDWQELLEIGFVCNAMLGGTVTNGN